MNFNQFQRELQKRNISPENAYMFTLIYERLIQMGKDVHDNANALLAIANSMQGLVQLHEGTQHRIQQVARGVAEGVDVRSEPLDPDEGKKH